jgi:dTDP-4-dehydrorhamnose reductase
MHGAQDRAAAQSPALELWGGIECTVNRVGDRFLDQSHASGHDRRISDLDLIADLGIRTLRYPVLWERHDGDWRWTDARLERLRDLGIRPIVGLVHHGSGPLHTSLVDPGFAAGLAEYAQAVAERYPWVDLWTPVNEPNTTARFSGLYGHWYPHGRDARLYAKCLVNQCRAVVLAMDAIRAVNPGAQLVQTDDLPKIHSTPALAYQAEHENERRWASFDLLTGTLGPESHVWRWLVDTVGFPEEELAWFLERNCPPDVIGVNHYLSGERWLDERIDRYSADAVGGNGRDVYADVLASRVLGPGADGPERVLREAWDRYRLPIAVTEAHNGCTREEQLRWLDEVWHAAEGLRLEGADLRAVTVWSLFGAYGWDKMLTAGLRHYEPGVFDLRSPEPRPTALASMARGLATRRAWEHPVLESPGWWRRPERIWYPPEGEVAPAPPSRARPLVVTGATGTLGRAFAIACEARGLAYRLTSRRELDIAEPEGLLDDLRPWAVVNTAGYVRVEEAEHEPERCFRENADGAAALAEACAVRGIPLVTFSSDLVFDGIKGTPYVESDAPAPQTVYGRSKAEAELRVLSAHPDALVVRTSAFFGPWDEHNFVTIALRELAAGRDVRAAADVTVSPTYVPDLVDAALDLLIDGERGIWHLANEGAVSWHELARAAAELLEVETSTLVAERGEPRGFALASERAWVMPPLEYALEQYAAAVRQCADDGRASAPDRRERDPVS